MAQMIGLGMTCFIAGFGLGMAYMRHAIKKYVLDWAKGQNELRRGGY